MWLFVTVGDCGAGSSLLLSKMPVAGADNSPCGKNDRLTLLEKYSVWGPFQWNDTYAAFGGSDQEHPSVALSILEVDCSP